jgi:surfeit locus 1 family protein
MNRTQAIRGLILPGVLSLLALAVLISLGNWQMNRLAWKENLMEMVSLRVKEPERALPPSSTWPSLDVSKNEYRTFYVSGRFLHRDEVHVYTVLSDAKGMYSGAGYWVLTPLALDDGGIVVINRGFVPQEMKNPSTRKDAQVEGAVRVAGLLRAPEQANYFTPVSDPSKNVWHRRDPRAIANVLSLQNVAPFMLDETRGYKRGDLPQPNETRISFTNNHLGYALTWYGLACTLIGVFGAFARQRLKGTR